MGEHRDLHVLTHSFPTRRSSDLLLDEIDERVKKKERVLVTTLTKRMAEELTKFMDRAGVKCRYIHSEVPTLERVEILRELRLGLYDVLVGVNLLRERSEEHTSELQSLMRISYAVFCLKKK